jgi:hypothetical protein
MGARCNTVHVQKKSNFWGRPVLLQFVVLDLYRYRKSMCPFHSSPLSLSCGSWFGHSLPLFNPLQFAQAIKERLIKLAFRCDIVDAKGRDKYLQHGEWADNTIVYWACTVLRTAIISVTKAPFGEVDCTFSITFPKVYDSMSLCPPDSPSWWHVHFGSCSYPSSLFFSSLTQDLQKLGCDGTQGHRTLSIFFQWMRRMTSGCGQQTLS